MNIQHHNSIIQCHMILQKSFQYADLTLKKHIINNVENRYAV